MYAIEETIQQLGVIKASNSAEIRLRRRLRAIFGTAFDNIIRIVSIGRIAFSNEQARSEAVQDVLDLEEEFNQAVLDEIEVIAEQARQELINDLARLGMFRRGSPVPQNITQFLREQTFIATRSTITRVSQDIMRLLAQCYNEGLGIYQTTQRLRARFERMRGYELQRIARTELQHAQNTSFYMSELDLRVPYHMWFTAQDSRVRGLNPEDKADHFILHGQITRVGQPFSNGQRYPGQRTVRIEEWINCRCFLVPYLMPHGFTAPNMDYFKEGDLIRIVR